MACLSRPSTRNLTGRRGAAVAPGHPPSRWRPRIWACPLHQPPTLRDPQALAELAALQPQAIVAVAYGQILRQDVLEIPPRGVLNIHPSLLPRHRGASPIPAAILAGDEVSGVTIMLMDQGLDTGPILATRVLAIEPADTAASLGERLAHLGADLLAEALPKWLRQKIEPRPQDDSQATKSPLLRKEQGDIDWDLPARIIWQQIRAFNPWPGSHTALDDEMVHIWQAWPLAGDSGHPPGTIVALSPDQRRELPPGSDPEAFAVQTGSGLLSILLVQRAGRRALPPGDFLRGVRDAIGRRLVTGQR